MQLPQSNVPSEVNKTNNHKKTRQTIKEARKSYSDSAGPEAGISTEMYGGVRRCTEVYGGVRRCTEVYGGVRRLRAGTEVYGGVRRCTEVYGGLRGMCTEVYGGVRRCTEVYGGSRLCTEVYGGSWRRIQCSWVVSVHFSPACCLNGLSLFFVFC
jgi:hypothetical protein